MQRKQRKLQNELNSTTSVFEGTQFKRLGFLCWCQFYTFIAAGVAGVSDDAAPSHHSAVREFTAATEATGLHRTHPPQHATTRSSTTGATTATTPATAAAAVPAIQPHPAPAPSATTPATATTSTATTPARHPAPAPGRGGCGAEGGSFVVVTHSGNGSESDHPAKRPEHAHHARHTRLASQLHARQGEEESQAEPQDFTQRVEHQE